MKKKILTIITGALCLLCPTVAAQDDVCVGGDISVLQSYEDNNVAYYDEQGTRIENVLQFLKSEAVC